MFLIHIPSKFYLINRPVYGLIFLFKYIPNSGYNPNILSNYDEDLYFAQQVIINACATQAILAILMNNEDKLDLGQDLMELKIFTRQMDSYMKGLSISNSEKIRCEHNKFARPEPFVFTGKKKVTEDDDVYHFVAYIHFKDKVYEIDGLREGPILIVDNAKNNDWVDKVKPAIINRINLYASNEIKFNLLSVVPDRRVNLEQRLTEVKCRQEAINLFFNYGDPKVNLIYKF
jgi:ubiquitin carboxyl-terminal hydrolase L5